MLDCSDDVYIDSTLLYSTDEVDYSDMFIYFQAVRDGTSISNKWISKQARMQALMRTCLHPSLLICVAPASHTVTVCYCACILITRTMPCFKPPTKST